VATDIFSELVALAADPLISNTGRCLDAPVFAPIAILLGIAAGLAIAFYFGPPAWKRFRRALI
jgi:hypothetical protein